MNLKTIILATLTKMNVNVNVEEVWKTVVNFSKYNISNFGNVRNSKSQRVLKPANLNGYLANKIYNDDGKHKNMLIHRLVGLAFIPNPEDKTTIDHIDRDKKNNNLFNLKWATGTEQNRNQIRPTNINSARAVWRLDKKTGERLEVYKSVQLAMQWVIDNNLIKSLKGATNISTVAQRKQGSAYGFNWEYECEKQYKDEEWKTIPSEHIHNTKGKYQVSQYGRIKLPSGRITEGNINISGYRKVGISTRIYSLHRIVAQTFIPNPENKPQVNHIDGNKQNACVGNLEWATAHENSVHVYTSGLRATKKVVQYDLENNRLNEFSSQAEASRELHIHRGNISSCCRKKTQTAGGYVFRYG